MNRHRVTFEPDGVSVEGAEEQSLMEIAAGLNLPVRSDCGGKGRCGKCLVAVNPSDHLSSPTESETHLLDPDQIQAGFRLACQTRAKGVVKVSIPETGADSQQAIGKTDIGGSFSCDPMVKRTVLTVSSPSQSGSRTAPDFVGHLLQSTNQDYDFKDPEALRTLSRPAFYSGEITLVHHLERGVTAVWAGKKERSLGIAVDIGTTTLAAYLCDLRSGKVVASAASANPQRRFGEDVISRITYANEQDLGLTLLQRTVVDGINDLITRCLREVGAEREEVDEVAVVGNTTMEQIFSGVHPHGLGFSPYLPVCRRPLNLRAGDTDLDLSPSTNIYVFPVISGFVGGDTVGVILSERPHERKEISLIVDIGTNGEVVLGNRDGLWATSCATGPALEGAHIECGMRAVAGAIHRVTVNPKDFRVDYAVLGDGNNILPRGLCGSGIIDAVAGMLRAGLLLNSGRIREGMPGVISDEQQIGRKFVLVPPEKAAAGREIGITLGDVRQIQLAKAALFVGIKLLMQTAGFAHFDRLVLTGAFGARFDWKNAVAIGMLPEISPGTAVEVVANAAGRGAVTALLDRKRREEAMDISERTQFIELAEDPNFIVEFPAATLFPEMTVA